MAALAMLCPWCEDVLMLDCYCYAGGQVDGTSSAVVVAAVVSVFDGGWSSRSKVVVVVVVEMHGARYACVSLRLGVTAPSCNKKEEVVHANT